MSDAPPEESSGGEGLPLWMATFADLMTLLMCFFVLLLSFSEMDIAKFKQMAGSMEEAFGVQAEIEVKMIPRGTSIIAQEFSPGRPERTVMNEVRQFTVNSVQNQLDIGQGRGDDGEKGEDGDDDSTRTAGGEAIDLEEAQRLAEEQARRLREELKDEIEAGSLLVRQEGTDVIVQILEKDSFASGNAQLESEFQPTLDRIGLLLAEMIGAISISGHTDDVPISTSQFRSNWDLSAMRATTVAMRLLDAGIDQNRMMISGHADTRPRVANTSNENRALNRRIDIALITSRTSHAIAPAEAQPQVDPVDETTPTAAEE